MDYVVNQPAWLPVLIQNSTTSAGVTGLAYGASGLAVGYMTPAGTVQTLTLTSANWKEVAQGMYLVLFPATILNTLGTFLYWATYTGATPYPAAINLTADLASLIQSQSNDVGRVAWTHVVLKNASPVQGAVVSYYSDAARTVLVPPAGTTDANGSATFLLDPGHYWVKVSISGESDRLGEEEVH